MGKVESKQSKRITKKAYYSRKVKEAARLLFYKHHVKPGVKGWELRRKFGANYPTILRILDDQLEKLGLQIKSRVFKGLELIS